jgi:hypothetical protein
MARMQKLNVYRRMRPLTEGHQRGGSRDDTIRIYDERDMPRLPNIQAERGKWDSSRAP